MLKAVLRGKKEAEMDPKRAARIRPLIRQGIAILKKIDQAKAQLEKNNAALLPYAEDLRYDTGLASSTFKSDQGTAVVKFADAVTYNAKDMPKIKKILGPLFAKMFHEVPVFAVSLADIPEIKAKLGKDFDRLVSADASYSHTKDLRELLCDGDSQVGKHLRDLIRIEPRRPVFNYEAVPAGEEAAAAKSKKSVA